MYSNIQLTRRVIMIGMTYKIPIAINGVISKTPSIGTIRLNGARIGSVTSSSITIKILYRLMPNHDSIIRAKTVQDKMRQKYWTKPTSQTIINGWKPVLLIASSNDNITKPIQTRTLRLGKRGFLCGFRSFSQQLSCHQGLPISLIISHATEYINQPKKLTSQWWDRNIQKAIGMNYFLNMRFRKLRKYLTGHQGSLIYLCIGLYFFDLPPIVVPLSKLVPSA